VTDSINGEPVGEHPSSEEVAAYLSNALTANDSATLEAHLAVCLQCRREVTSARRLIRSHASPTLIRWVAPAAAAAAVLAVVLLSPLRSARLETPSKRATEDAAVSATMPKIRIVSPASGDTVKGSQVVFVWQGVRNASLYRLTLTDAGGSAVWTRDTSDTTLTLPASLSLGKGQNYFWFVDALGADGTAVTTGTHRFTAGH
jgi:hypothetical protein